jgi:hypothetical protein
VVGLLAFDGRLAAILGTALGGLIGGVLYGAFVGSLAGLESPDPGHEPSETAHPLAEPPVDEESSSDVAPSDRDRR